MMHHCTVQILVTYKSQLFECIGPLNYSHLLFKNANSAALTWSTFMQNSTFILLDEFHYLPIT